MNLSELDMAELTALKEKIKQEIKQRQTDEIVKARKEVQAMAQRLGVLVKDLVSPPARTKGEKIPARYRHPENSELQWTGRGRQPKWVKEWVEAGKSMDDLRI